MNKGNKQPNPGAPIQIPQLVELLTQIGCSTDVMTEVRDRVSGLASLEDTAADKQRTLGDLLDQHSKVQSHLLHFREVRDKRRQQLLAAEEAVAKQETAIVDLAERFVWSKRATKTPTESENGGAEFVMDSDLKQAEDEPNVLLFPPEYEADTQGNKRRMAAKAKAAPFVAQDLDQAREFWNKLKSECRDWFRQCASRTNAEVHSWAPRTSFER